MKRISITMREIDLALTWHKPLVKALRALSTLSAPGYHCRWCGRALINKCLINCPWKIARDILAAIKKEGVQ